MFKKTQNHILLHHPLIWNTKFVPMVIIIIAINILFFFSGYAFGAIDFTQLYENRFNNVFFDYIVGFSVIISALVLIIWLVFYLRNNAYKSFYPQKNNSLYKEWLLLLVLCALNCLYSTSFDYGYHLRGRSYFDSKELTQRLDLLNRASIFIDGSYNSLYENPSDYEYSEETVVEEGTATPKDSVCYFGNLYPEFSLMNKNTITYSLNRENDSINEWTVKRWMYNRQKDSIQKLMDDFFKLAKSHKLTSNITPEKWLELTYLPKLYNNYYEVSKDSISPVSKYGHHIDDSEVSYDTINNIFIIKNGKIKDFYPKYHVPFTQLNNAYDKLSTAWVRPIDFEVLNGSLCFGFVLSLVLFSFRVTSGKSWLIAGVLLGLSGLLTLITTLITTSLTNHTIQQEVLFCSIWLIIILLLFIWFMYICRKKKRKGISEIIVNLLIWLLPMVLIILWILLYSYCNYMSHQTNDYLGQIDEYYIARDWMGNNYELLLYGNMLLIIIYMYFFTGAIKKWKGIAEA